MISKYTFIINPEAGRGAVRSLLPKIQRLLKHKRLSFEILETGGPEHATVLAQGITDPETLLIAVGGDGTTHEVATGMLESKSTLSVLPVGSGNDFARLLGFGRDLATNIESLITGRDYRMDVGEYRIESSSGNNFAGIFVNSLGIGIDATISYNSKKIRSLKGLPLYLVATLRTLKTFAPISVNFESDSDRFEGKVFLVCLGNGPYEGGGFMLTPGAKPDDGKLEVCIIRSMPVWNAVRLIPKIISGRHAGERKIHILRAERVRLTSPTPFYVHCDGEIPTDAARSINIKILPKKLRVRAASGHFFTAAPL